MLLKSIEQGELLRTRMGVRFAVTNGEQSATRFLNEICKEIDISTLTVLQSKWESRILLPGDIVMFLDAVYFRAGSPHTFYIRHQKRKKAKDYALVKLLFEETIVYSPFFNPDPRITNSNPDLNETFDDFFRPLEKCNNDI